jgi:hypothetical protein
MYRMDKSAMRRAEVLSRLRQFEQDKAHAAMSRTAHEAGSAHEVRDLRRNEVEAVGRWKVPSADGGAIELSIYSHAVGVEASAMTRWSEADEHAGKADRALDVARDNYGRALLARDVVARRQQRVAAMAATEVEHRDADAVGDMWLARRQHGSD